jgi:hypothetical protein
MGPADRDLIMPSGTLRRLTIDVMQAQTASGWTLLAVASLLVLAACSNSPSSASGNAVATRVAGNGGMDSVAAVSDALGQRLDTMLSARQGSR